jgi:hypothetical protein
VTAPSPLLDAVSHGDAARSRTPLAEARGHAAVARRPRGERP